MVDLVPAEEEHIPYIVEHMREADRIECTAFGDSPERSLRSAFNGSLWAMTAFEGGKPQAMLGVVSRSMIAGKGVPWMLGTERIYSNPRAIVRFAPAVIEAMTETFCTLENLVSVDNERAISFLRHFGWKLSDDRHTIGGVEFVRFCNV